MMKMMKKVCSLLCIFAIVFSTILIPLNVSYAQSSANEYLLSGNTLGFMFAGDTPTKDTGATYAWVTEGTFATDGELITNDGNGTAQKLKDGMAGSSGDNVCYGSWSGGTYGTIIYDLKSLYDVSKIQVWSSCTDNQFMKQFNVYVSSDGVNYAEAGNALNTNARTSGMTVTDLETSATARYIKIIMVRDPGAYQMVLGEVAVWGDVNNGGEEQPSVSKLLSGNALGSLLASDTPVISTGAIYSWVTEGTFATDGDLITNDGNGTAQKLKDGMAGSSGDNVCYGSWSGGTYGTIIYDLKCLYDISKIQVWSNSTDNQFMKQFNVYMSSDGTNYTDAGSVLNTNERTSGMTVTDLETSATARYIKIIMVRDPGAYQMVLGEVAVWGNTSSSGGVTPPQNGDSLLSDNQTGNMFTTGSAIIATGATYTWLPEGLYKTDTGLLTDDQNGQAKRLMDGAIDIAGSYASSNISDQVCQYGNIIYDLKNVYQLSRVQLWTNNSADTYMKQYQVYTSIDGQNYTSIGSAVNANEIASGWASADYDFKPKILARYIKLIAEKASEAKQLQIGEVAVWGRYPINREMALLSNNSLTSTGEYNIGIPKIATGATYRWITEQPFPTDSSLIITDNDQKEDSFGGKPDLMDGSSVEQDESRTCHSAWGSQGKYGTVVYDLKDIYQVGKIDVWSMADNQKYMDGYEVQVSTDGSNYDSLGYTANPYSRTSNGFVNTIAYGNSGKNARYVKIIMHNANDSYQLKLGEIAVWGWKVYDTAKLNDGQTEQVEPVIELKNYSTMKIDWSSYNHVANNVGGRYRIYIETSDFADTTGLTPKVLVEPSSMESNGKYYVYFGLKPETTYYVAVTPYDKNSGIERKDVRTVKVVTPSVLGVEKAGDVFAINDYPYGGGGYENHGNDEDMNLLRKLSLLKEIGGINYTRWWFHDSWMQNLYGKYGMNFHLFFNKGAVLSDNEHGVWTFSTGNEPHFGGISPADYAASIKANHEALLTQDTKNLLCEPTLGGIDPTIMDWLRQLYESDGKNGADIKTYFNVMDVHPYCKLGEPVPEGLTVGAPEGLIQKIATLRGVMNDYGDANKPIIFSELGWSLYTGQGYLAHIDADTQRNYLVRAYTISIAEGIKRVHWYAFQDSGTDSWDLEDNFGIIDWYGNPKKSYFGYYIMSRELGNAKYIGKMENTNNPCYGYTFWNEERNEYINALWAADESTKNVSISTNESNLTLVSVDGSIKHVPAVNGIASFPITGVPVFIHSKASISVDSISNFDGITSIAPVSIKTNVGVAPVLPSKVTVTYGDNSTMEADVVWDSIDPSQYETSGSFIVSGTVEGTAIKAQASIIVEETIPLRINIKPKPVQVGAWDQWNIDIELENITSSTLNGSVVVEHPIELVKQTAFSDLKPGMKKHIIIQVPVLMVNSTINLSCIVNTDNYESISLTRDITFLAALKAETAPTIDGVINAAEWSDSMGISLNNAADVYQKQNWSAEDLSGSSYVKWDNENLYVAVSVNDNHHNQEHSGGDIWNGDSIQFAIDTNRSVNSVENGHHEFGFSLGNDQSITKWRWLASNGKATGSVDNSNCSITRDGTKTDYEIAIPWSEILSEGSTIQENTILGFSLLINDDDGNGRGWIEYMGGIGGNKNESEFGDLVLVSPPSAIEENYTIETTFSSDHLAANELLYASITVTNNKDEDGNVLEIVALYDENNRMVNVSYASKEFAVGQTDRLNAGFRLPANINGYKVRVFVWDGKDIKTSNMEPLSNVIELQ